MKRLNRLFLFVLCACFFSIPINAQPEKVSEGGTDIRVAKALNEIKTEYEVGKDGMYKVTYQTTDKRTQSAFIDSEIVTVHGLKMRLVFSFAQVDGNLPPPAIMNFLLEENLENYPHIWAIQKDKGNKFSIVSSTYVPADSDGKSLELALSGVMVRADKLEERLTKKDEY